MFRSETMFIRIQRIPKKKPCMYVRNKSAQKKLGWEPFRNYKYAQNKAKEHDPVVNFSQRGTKVSIDSKSIIVCRWKREEMSGCIREHLRCPHAECTKATSLI